MTRVQVPDASVEADPAITSRNDGIDNLYAQRFVRYSVADQVDQLFAETHEVAGR